MMWGIYNNGFGYSMVGGLFGGIAMLAFWILFFALIVWIVKEVSGTNRKESSSSDSRALEILKERYAKGEITKEEFEEKKKDLN